MTLVDYDEEMASELCDPEYAAAYLAECLSYDEPDTFLRALREVVKAQTSMSTMARKLEASRPALYRSLNEGGNPEFRTIQSVLNAIGLQMSITPKRQNTA